MPIYEIGIIPCPKRCPKAERETWIRKDGVHTEGSPKRQKDTLPLTVVQGDDVETVEKLAFIFMDSLHLDVEERVGVDMDFVFLL